MFWYSLQKIPLHVFFLKGSSANNTDVGKKENSQEKSTLQLISSAYEKCEYEHISSWYIKSTLCKRFLNCKKNVKNKINQLLAKQFSILYSPFYLLNMYGDFAFSILVLSTKKRSTSFLKKVSFFRKCFKVKVSKTFTFRWLSHKNMPISQTEGYFKNPQHHFLEDLFLLVLK